MNRRDFIRQGSLWVAGALVVEPVVKRLWAFPTNPIGPTGSHGMRVREFFWTDPDDVVYRLERGETVVLSGSIAWRDVTSSVRFAAIQDTRVWRVARACMAKTGENPAGPAWRDLIGGR